MKRFATLIVFVLVASFACADPILDAISDQTVIEGEALSFAITNSAPDNGTTEYLIDGAASPQPVGGNDATLTKASDTAADFGWTAPLVSADTQYTVEITAQDANSTDTGSFNITVTNKAAGPIINAIPDQTINEGETRTWTLTCSEPDNGSTSWALGNTSLGSLSAAADTQVTFTWTAPIVSVDKDYMQTITASDSDTQSSEDFQITVQNLAGGITLSDIEFGGDTQERSNPDEDENVRVTDTFTITNNEAMTLTNVQVTWPGSSSYNISYVSSTEPATEITNGVQIASIASGETVTVSLRANIPEDLPCFFRDRTDPNDDRRVDIGDLTLSGAGIATQTSNVYMEAENNLEIESLYITLDGDEDKISDGEEIEEIKPGARIEVRLNAENRFSSGDDVEMEDVEFTFFANDGDLDEEESEDIGDIGPGDEEEGEFSFTLDDDIEEDTYDVQVWVEAEDEYGATHGELYEIEFTVEREDEDIVFRRLELDDQEIDLCTERDTRLNVEIENQGSDDSDEVVLVVKNDLLNVFFRTLNIEIDEEDDYSRSFTIVVPQDAEEGTYSIEAYTYFDLDDYDDESLNSFGTVDLRIRECVEEEEEEEQEEQEEEEQQEEEETEVIIEDEGQDTIPQTGGAFATAVPAERTTTSDTRSTGYMALLVLAYIVVIAIILKLIVSLVKK